MRELPLKLFEGYGVRVLPLMLLETFLKDRLQNVKIVNNYSHNSTINVGVPQGEIMGIINDLPNVSNSISTNDTTMFASGICYHVRLWNVLPCSILECVTMFASGMCYHVRLCNVLLRVGGSI